MKFYFVGDIFPYKKSGQLVVPGGGAAHAFFLSRELVKRGHHVKMITGKMPGSAKCETIDGIEFVRYGAYMPWFNRSIFITLKDYIINIFSCFIALRDILQKERPDFLVTPMSFMFPPAFILARAFKVPLIAEVHDVYTPRIYLRHYTNMDRSFLVYSGTLYIWLYNKLPKYASLVETVLAQSIPLLINNYGVDREKIFVTGNGVDIEKYEYSTHKQQIVVVLGRLVSYKRVDMAIEIFKRVKQNVHNAKIIIIGDGPEREKLKKMAGNNDVEFTGYISENEKVEILQRAKILLTCSEFEGFGMVPLEALACGAIPVVSNIPAHREILGTHGIFFRDTTDAANNISELLLNEKKREFKAQEGRNFVETIYTWPNICDRFIKSVRANCVV